MTSVYIIHAGEGIKDKTLAVMTFFIGKLIVYIIKTFYQLDIGLLNINCETNVYLELFIQNIKFK